MQITFRYYDSEYPSYLFKVVKQELGLTPTFEHSNGTGDFSFSDNTTDYQTLIKCAALCDAIWYSDSFYREWKIVSKDYDSLNEMDNLLYDTCFDNYEKQYYSLVWQKILIAESEGKDTWLHEKRDDIRVRQINKETFVSTEKVCYIFCEKYDKGIYFACDKETLKIWVGRAEGDSGEVSSEFWNFIQECKDIVRDSFNEWKSDCYDIDASDCCKEGDCTCKPFGYMGWDYGAKDLGILLNRFY